MRDSLILSLPFIVGMILGIIFAQFFTVTIQSMISITLIIYFVWALNNTTFEVSPHILLGLIGLSLIAGFILGDILYMFRPVLHWPNIHFQVFR